MDIMSFITENMLVIIPVIYVLGMFLKNTEKVTDKFIPVILLPIGVALSLALGGFNADAIMQGILCVGGAILANQTVKQLSKEE